MCGLIEVYLPDLKFYRSSVSKEYCHASDYYEVARTAIAEIYRQTGPCRFHREQNTDSPELMMTKGVMVRHLLLPGLEEDAFRLLKQLYKTYDNHIYLSIMSQYTPMPQMQNHKTLSQPVNYQIYDQLLDRLIDLGIENAYFQEEGVDKDSFIPLFDYEGL